jgi:hypothetical protein
MSPSELELDVSRAEISKRKYAKVKLAVITTSLDPMQPTKLGLGEPLNLYEVRSKPLPILNATKVEALKRRQKSLDSTSKALKRSDSSLLLKENKHPILARHERSCTLNAAPQDRTHVMIVTFQSQDKSMERGFPHREHLTLSKIRSNAALCRTRSKLSQCQGSARSNSRLEKCESQMFNVVKASPDSPELPTPKFKFKQSPGPFSRKSVSPIKARPAVQEVVFPPLFKGSESYASSKPSTDATPVRQLPVQTRSQSELKLRNPRRFPREVFCNSRLRR